MRFIGAFLLFLTGLSIIGVITWLLVIFKDEMIIFGDAFWFSVLAILGYILSIDLMRHGYKIGNKK